MRIHISILGLIALLLAGSADAADPPKLPTTSEKWRDGWISIRHAPHGAEPGVAVLHNRSLEKISISISGGRACPVLLRRGGDGWTFAGPGYCGTGMSDRVLAPRDSLRFEFRPETMLGPAVRGESHEYRVCLSVREAGGWTRAVSGASFRYP